MGWWCEPIVDGKRRVPSGVMNYEYWITIQKNKIEHEQQLLYRLEREFMNSKPKGLQAKPTFLRGLWSKIIYILRGYNK